MYNNFKIRHQIITIIFIIILIVSNSFFSKSFSASIMRKDSTSADIVNNDNQGNFPETETVKFNNYVLIADAVKNYITRIYNENPVKQSDPNLILNDFQNELMILQIIENKYQNCFPKNDKNCNSLILFPCLNYKTKNFNF